MLFPLYLLAKALALILDLFWEILPFSIILLDFLPVLGRFTVYGNLSFLAYRRIIERMRG